MMTETNGPINCGLSPAPTDKPHFFINVLGMLYLIILDVPRDELPDGCDGVIDHSKEEIKIAKIIPDKNTVEGIDKYTLKVIKHEIIHAFLYESGLHVNSHETDSWATDEEIIDWMAIQLDKIYDAYIDAMKKYYSVRHGEDK